MTGIGDRCGIFEPATPEPSLLMQHESGNTAGPQDIYVTVDDFDTPAGMVDFGAEIIDRHARANACKVAICCNR